MPYDGITPAFVVWPLTAEHVKLAVGFAVAHNLCIMVAGTGHDFMNRHSCADGFFIRTSLLKDIEWDLNDSKGFGHPDGNVKFGAGIVFSEAHESAAENGRFVASGWAITVGIVGWSIGGGHGPFGPSKGLGVDNILAVDIVLANGELVTANETHHADLLFALRGGGGSTWGVITAITVRAHLIPNGGFTVFSAIVANTLCATAPLSTFLGSYMQWALALDKSFSGLNLISGVADPEPGHCGAAWVAIIQYVYLGNSTDALFTQTLAALTPAMNANGVLSRSEVNYPDFFSFMKDKDLEPIVPINNLFAPSQSYAGGVPSVLVSRDVASSAGFLNRLVSRISACKGNPAVCNRREELYSDVTGHLNSPRDSFPAVAIHPAFRTAALHHVSPVSPKDRKELDSLGQAAYFGESAFNFKSSEFAGRYWGVDNHNRLLETKQAYDPKGVFGCRNCVGSEGANAGVSKGASSIMWLSLFLCWASQVYRL